MNPNMQKIETDEIDVVEDIKWLWKGKIIILSISLMFFFQPSLIIIDYLNNIKR